MGKKRKWLKQLIVGLLVAIMIVSAIATICKQKKAEEVLVADSVECIKFLEIEVKNTATKACKAVGTGVIYQVDDDGVWIATAAHVLSKKTDEDKILLGADGLSMECQSWVMVDRTDLAYLYLPREALPAKAEIIPVEADKESYDKLGAGNIVQAWGYCTGRLTNYSGELIENWIYVEDFEEYMMVARCEIEPGMSGGGLYDREGHFIGMICGGNEEGEVVAVPWHVMHARFEEK